mmetsp:Transcript_20723/g.30669  ORF Transcript_20723/g.30669 Transcript_20723/m.30669 type:complete len:96 (+) Transcript_20723:318-605(+)
MSSRVLIWCPMWLLRSHSLFDGQLPSGRGQGQLAGFFGHIFAECNQSRFMHAMNTGPRRDPSVHTLLVEHHPQTGSAAQSSQLSCEAHGRLEQNA